MNLKNIYSKAYLHCRSPNILTDLLESIIINLYKSFTFEQIIIEIDKICSDIKGIGILIIYDISCSICRYHNIGIKYIYLIGSGPLNAIKTMKKEHLIKIQIIKHLKLKYITRDDYSTLDFKK